jgi:pyrroline-5-carboxylate reductase
MVLQLPGPLVLVGAGKMGGALLEGWLARGLDPSRIVVQDPDPGEQARALLARRQILNVAPARAAALLSEAPSVIVLAVKPQLIDATVPPLVPLVAQATLVISIAAGRTISSLEAYFPPGAAIVRAMPNTPASIGRGISVCVANGHATPEQRERCEDLLAAVGEVVWVDDESVMDAVTAVSGSGPAYVFLLAECLAEAGREQGLDAELARRLAIATVAGAGELMHRSGIDPSVLRENVTSPGGTTAAALSVLMGPDGLKPLLVKAVAAAAGRSRELARS